MRIQSLNTKMISARNLVKSFKKKGGKIAALDHVNLEISRGEIYGLIGPTGAGKTTTIKVLSTLVLPDEGTATIDGYDVIKEAKMVRDRLGVLAGEFSRTMYWRLSGRGNLKFFSKLRSLSDMDERIDELLKLFRLEDRADDLVMHYSTGMKHKLALAVALLADPPVLFLDEPLTGVDPLGAYELKSFIHDKLKDRTIIWTSHNLHEIESMCDRIGLISKGRIILEGSPNDLKRRYWNCEKILVSVNEIERFKDFEGATIQENKKIVEIRTDNPENVLLKLLQFVKENNIKIEKINSVEPSLEDIFVHVVNSD